MYSTLTLSMGALDKFKKLPLWGRGLIVGGIAVVVLIIILAATGQFSTKAAISHTASPNYSILQAKYFLPENGINSGIDITKEVVAKTDLVKGVIPLTNFDLFPTSGGPWFGTRDFAPGQVKTISVRYEKVNDTNDRIITFQENQHIIARNDIHLQ